MLAISLYLIFQGFRLLLFFRSRRVLFPLAVCLFKLHLNHTAIFAPNSAHLGYWIFMGIFGVVAGFFLTYRAH
jgi:hypothetical protein